MGNQSRTKNSVKNILYSFGTYFLTLLLSFVNRTYFIQLLSDEYLGLNGLFTNILSFLSLAELGVGSAINFALYKPISDDNTELIKSLMQLYRKFYITIGLIVLVVGWSLTPFLQIFIKDMPEGIPNLRFYYILYVLNSGITYFYTYKRSLIICNQKEYISSITTTISKVLICISQIILLWATHSYMLYLLASIVIAFIENVFISKIADRMYPYLRDKDIKNLPVEVLHNIKKNIGAMVFHKIGAAVVFSTDTIIISKFVGLIAAGMYSNYTLIITSLNNIVGKIFTATVASVGSLVATDDTDHMKDVFDRVLFLNFWIRCFCSIALICLLQPFIRLWLGNTYLLSTKTVFIIVANFYIGGMRSTVNTFKDAAGLFWYDRYKPIIESVLNIILSIPLAIRYGVAGVLLGTIGSTLLVPFWFEAYVLFKYLFHKKVFKYLIKQLLYLIFTIVSGGICVLCCNLVTGDGILSFVIQMVICVTVPNIIVIVVWHRTKEFIYFVDLVKKILPVRKTN